MALTLSATTKLEAVNTMLFTIGESPVNTLAGGNVVDAVTAERTLDDVSREVQSEGWAFNYEKNYPLLRAAFDPQEISVPPNALHCDPSDKQSNIVVRAGKLYDLDNHTHLFPNTPKIECDIIWLLTFEELPEAARRYITIRAARIFQDGAVGSEKLHAFTEKDEMKALWRLKRHNARVRDKNILTASAAVHRIIAR